jgi:hypothetical protein
MEWNINYPTRSENEAGLEKRKEWKEHELMARSR